MAGRVETPTRTFKAAEAMVAFRAVALTSNADEVAYATPGDRIIGITERDVASGDEVAVRLVSAEGTHKITANAATSVGDKLAVAASGKFGATPGGPATMVCLEAASGDNSVIEAAYISEPGHALLYANTAASAAHTNTTDEALFDTKFTIPANSLKAGDVLKIRYQGIATATNSTDTLLIKLYIGGLSGTALLVGTATDVANNNIFAGEATVVIRTVGTTGTFVAVGTHTEAPAASGTASHATTEITASTTINTTVAQEVGVGADWSVANAGNSCRLDIFTVERLRK